MVRRVSHPRFGLPCKADQPLAHRGAFRETVHEHEPCLVRREEVPQSAFEIGSGDSLQGFGAGSNGGSSAGESAEYDVGHGPAIHGFGVGGFAFVVAGQASARGDPGQGAFYRPAFGLDLEVVLSWLFADDVHLAAQDVCGPLGRAAGEGLVGPDLAMVGWSRRVHGSGRFASSRSWTLAATTWTARSRPRVSVKMNRLRPLVFLPASKPLVAAGTESAAPTDCGSIGPADGCALPSSA